MYGLFLYIFLCKFQRLVTRSILNQIKQTLNLYMNSKITVYFLSQKLISSTRLNLNQLETSTKEVGKLSEC